MISLKTNVNSNVPNYIVINNTMDYPENMIQIKRTFFGFCVSSKPGGAFYIKNDICSINVILTVFHHCKSLSHIGIGLRSSSSGGAFCFIGLSASFSYICVFKCRSEGIGVAFYSQCFDYFIQDINTSTIVFTETLKGKYTFIFEGGVTSICGLNSTKNQGNFGTGGSFGSKPLPLSGYIRFSQFSMCGGTSVFLFQVSSMENRGNKLCNFLNNSLLDLHTGVLCISSELIIKKFCFFGNTGRQVYTTSKIYIYDCITDQKSLGAFNLIEGNKVNAHDYRNPKLSFIEICNHQY